MAKLKKSLTEKIADGVDHLLHPSHEVESEAESTDESETSADVSTETSDVKESSKHYDSSINEHAKFQKFKKG